MKKPIRVSLIILVCVTSCICAIAVGVLGAGYFLVVRDPISSSDGIVVLSGGGVERLEHAVNLVLKGTAKKIIFTETGDVDAGTGVKVTRGEEDRAAQLGVRKVDIIVTEGISRTTLEEARAVLALAKEREWKKLIIVTDSFHSRRTKMIFLDVFSGSRIRIRVNPVDEANYWYKPSRWFLDSEFRKATVYEYMSMIFYILRIDGK